MTQFVFFFQRNRIGQDLGHRQLARWMPNLFRGTLLCYSGKIMFSTLSLLLTGKATPFLHNGINYEGSEDMCVSYEEIFNIVIKSFEDFWIFLENTETFH